MRLFITDSPLHGELISQALCKHPKKEKGFIRCNSDVVTWCYGQLFQLANPESYHNSWAKWELSTLPIVPEKWHWLPQKNQLDQLRKIERLIIEAETIVHAASPDRESQLTVDTILRHTKVNPYPNNEKSNRPVYRLVLENLTHIGIELALANLKDNSNYKAIADSARCRQKSDWLYGINMSRLLTLLARNQGDQQVYSVGRVQTPVVSMIKKGKFPDTAPSPCEGWQLDVHIHLPVNITSQPMHLSWIGMSNTYQSFKKGNRLASHQDCLSVGEAIQDKELYLQHWSTRETVEPPPRLFDLSELQQEAQRLFSLSMEETASIANELYEKYQLITFPRPNCHQLPENLRQDCEQLVATIAQNTPALTDVIRGVNKNFSAKCWRKQSAEMTHGVIPTTQPLLELALPENHRHVYQLIAHRFLLQFYRDEKLKISESRVTIDSQEFSLIFSAKVSRGWRKVESHLLPPEDFLENRLKTAEYNKIASTFDALRPHTSLGEVLVSEIFPQPPLSSHQAQYTEIELVKALADIKETISDPLIKKTLRNNDGLGTEKTRSHIIEMLYQREYIKRNGDKIRIAEKGISLLEMLPEVLTQPDRTAIWEARLNTIGAGTETAAHFLQEFQSELARQMTATIKHNTLPQMGKGQPEEAQQTNATINDLPPLTNIPNCPTCQQKTQLSLGKFGVFYSCSQYPACRGKLPFSAIFEDKQDSIDQKKSADAQNDSKPRLSDLLAGRFPCPECHAELILRSGKYGEFWGCSKYPRCRCRIKNINGSPDMKSYLFGK